MTTIAWDGETLAGDKQATCGNTAYPTTKVFKVKVKGKKFLVGFSGDLADGQAFVKFVKRGFKDKPEFKNFTGIVVNQDGSIARYDQDPNYCVMHLESYAIGSGCDYALGAIAFGATAVEAVLIATDLDIHTGLGVDSVSF